MAHKMLQFRSLLFYMISFVLGFFIGVSYAGWVEAGKDQMLAGGAVVLGYGVIGAVIYFVISLFLIRQLNSKIVYRLNIIISISILAFLLFYKIKFDKRQKNRFMENLGFIEEFLIPNVSVFQLYETKCVPSLS